MPYAGGVEGEHVLVSLAKQDASLGAHGLYRLVQAVEDMPLVVGGTVGGVDVFPPLLRRGKAPSGEPGHLSPGGVYREDEPA